MTMMMSAKLPEVTQLLVPLRTQSSPSRTAWQRRAEASEPASGSLRAKAPLTSRPVSLALGSVTDSVASPAVLMMFAVVVAV